MSNDQAASSHLSEIEINEIVRKKRLLEIILPETLFSSICSIYKQQTGYSLVALSPNGDSIYLGESDVSSSDNHHILSWILVTEAMCWGEPTARWLGEDLIGWGVPVMANNEVVGGLIVKNVPVFTDLDEEHFIGDEINRACESLRSLCLDYNLCNRIFLDQVRSSQLEERKRAETIHLLKNRYYDNIREIYLRVEPDLLGAIRSGNRKNARVLLNEVLTGIYFMGHNRLDLLKSYLMELVVMMYRSAVEGGADPSDVLGINYKYLSDLYEINDEEDLSHWSRSMLETLIDSIRDNRAAEPAMLVTRAISIIKDQLSGHCGRDEVAKMVGLSPSHFSRIIREKTGKSFSELLLDFRIERAIYLLTSSDDPVSDISVNCGFYDQSHFSRLFKKETGFTPSAYRKEKRRE